MLFEKISKNQYVFMVPEAVVSGTQKITAVDSNTPTSGVGLMATVESVDLESAAGGEVGEGLSKRGASTCSDFFDSSTFLSELAGEPIMVNFGNSGTESVKTVIFWLTKGNIWGSYSAWSLVSLTGAQMSLKDSVLEPNSRGKRADLNLTTFLFVFMAAGIPIANGSRDKAISGSVDTFPLGRSAG